eukprot:scaffold10883_cov74-Phaeocystis_antarctica.AAC.7
MHLPCISPAPPLHLPCTSPQDRSEWLEQLLREEYGGGAGAEAQLLGELQPRAAAILRPLPPRLVARRTDAVEGAAAHALPLGQQPRAPAHALPAAAARTDGTAQAGA